ncbi:MAG: class I SAM-dependent methyltransferase, partial [Candidatus Hodarchaeota archaeon]
LFWLRPANYSEETNFSERRLNSDPDGIHSLILDYVSKSGQLNILDLGCGNGVLGQEIRNKYGDKHYLCGVELDPQCAEMARPYYDNLFVGDIMNLQFLKNSWKKFDLILLVEVIEHLMTPSVVLRNLHHFLKNGSTVYITTPNVAHWSIRLRLAVRGDFGPDLLGLDPTHVRFFTFASLEQMLEKTGYDVVSKVPVPWPNGAQAYREYSQRFVRSIQRKLVRYFPRVFAFQMAFFARSKLLRG